MLFMMVLQNCVLCISIIQNNIQHFARCDDERFNREMPDVSGDKPCFFAFSLFHDDFIEYSVFRIWQFDFERSCLDIKSLVTKSKNDIFDDALRQMELWS